MASNELVVRRIKSSGRLLKKICAIEDGFLPGGAAARLSVGSSNFCWAVVELELGGAGVSAGRRRCARRGGREERADGSML